MPHTHASVTEFARLQVEGGTEYGTASDADILMFLEAASRQVESFCGRSAYGSGFGPRIGTNVYDAAGGSELWFRDDLLSFTSGTAADKTGGTATAVVETTDFYLDDGGQYVAPYRRLRLHGLTSVTVGSGLRIWSIVAKWGYSDERLTHTTLAAAITSTTATTATTASPPSVRRRFGVAESAQSASKGSAIAKNTVP